MISLACSIFVFFPKDGNDFTEPYQEMQFFLPQILRVKLSVEEPKIVFEPPLKECWDLISRCFSEILHSAEELPKVLDKLYTAKYSMNKPVYDIESYE